MKTPSRQSTNASLTMAVVCVGSGEVRSKFKDGGKACFSMCKEVFRFDNTSFRQISTRFHCHNHVLLSHTSSLPYL